MTYDTEELGRGAGESRRRTLFLTLARVVGYLIVPLYVAGVCATYLLAGAAGLGDEASLVANIESALLQVAFGAFAVVGALLLLKRPQNPIGWIMAANAFMLSVVIALGYYATYIVLTRGQPDALAVFGAWIFNCFWFLMLALTFVYLPLLFPDGRLLSRRWLPVAGVAGAMAFSRASAATSLIPGMAWGYVSIVCEIVAYPSISETIYREAVDTSFTRACEMAVPRSAP